MEDKNKQNFEHSDEHLEIDKLLTPEEFNELTKPNAKEESKLYASNIIKSKDVKKEYPKFEDFSTEKNENPQTDDEIQADQSSQEYLIRNFKDFLVLPKISETKTADSSRVIHQQSINKQSESDEMITKPQFQELLTGETSIVVNRNEDGEIDTIEVYCKDGEKVVIRFEFEDDSTTKAE